MIIIYYDKNLKKSKENLNNFIKLRESFYGNEIYGVDTFDKFKFLIILFKKTNQNYYIISSGSCAKEFISSGYFEETINRIIDYMIYCFNKEEYLPLLKYSRISMIESVKFENIINKIKDKLNSMEKASYYNCSSFLLMDEYLGTPLEVHKRLIEYFDENYNVPSFNESIKKRILDLLNKIAQTKYDYENAKNIIENIKDETHLIRSYTAESIIVYFLNKSLRDVDDKLIEFAGLLYYALYKYYYDNPKIKINTDMTFYRKITLSIKDLYSYDLFEGKIICLPSFVSTSNDEDAFYFPAIQKHKSLYGTGFLGEKYIYETREKCVLLKINYKFKESSQCPCFDIKNCSEFEYEKEYLFPPFSFFKILKFTMNEGTRDEPTVIELETVPKCNDFEKNLKRGGIIFYNQKENIVECILDNFIED